MYLAAYVPKLGIPIASHAFCIILHSIISIEEDAGGLCKTILENQFSLLIGTLDRTVVQVPRNGHYKCFYHVLPVPRILHNVA